MTISGSPDDKEKYSASDEEFPLAIKSGIRWDKENWTGEFLTDELHEGERGRVHGGIITYLLDEAMARTVLPEYKDIATADIRVRFRNQAPLYALLIVTAWRINQRRNLVETGARLCLQDGTLIADSTATIFIISK